MKRPLHRPSRGIALPAVIFLLVIVGLMLSAGLLMLTQNQHGQTLQLQASRALALLNGRTHVIPEDIRALRHVVLRHRVLLTFEADAEGIRSEEIIDQIFASVPTP